MFSKICILALAALVVTTMADPVPADQATAVNAVVSGNAKLTQNLYNILATEKPGENIFFSPTSIHTVLSLVEQGAKGETDKALTTALGLPKTKLATASGYKSIIQSLNGQTDVILKIANKIYVAEKYTLNKDFKAVAVNSFFSDAQNLNFNNNVAAAGTINTWVEDNTNHKIKDLIKPDDLDSLTRLVLVNAIYFKGDWKYKFDKAATKEEDFHVTASKTVKCQMMHITKKYDYKSDSALDAQIIRLPYKNDNISLVVILPNKKDGIADLESKLKDANLNTITQDMYNTEVILSLPKFKIETTIPLNEPLKKLGLGPIFSDDADFSGLLDSPEPLQVSKVIQKAFIEVNEEGAEAAAATAVVAKVQMALIKLRPSPVFEANHPFIIVLETEVDNNQETLFMGKIVDPQNGKN